VHRLQNSYPTDMLVGLAVQVAYLLVFGAVAIAWFRRKDIPSRIERIAGSATA